jgi:hypothetical protein
MIRFVLYSQYEDLEGKNVRACGYECHYCNCGLGICWEKLMYEVLIEVLSERLKIKN